MTNPISLAKAYIQYYRAKHLADQNHHATGIRYYVVSTTNRTLVVGDKRGLRHLDYEQRVKNGTLRESKNLSVQRLEHSSFYYTPYSDDIRGRILPHVRRAKRKECIRYIIKKYIQP